MLSKLPNIGVSIMMNRERVYRLDIPIILEEKLSVEVFRVPLLFH